MDGEVWGGDINRNALTTSLTPIHRFPVLKNVACLIKERQKERRLVLAKAM